MSDLESKPADFSEPTDSKADCAELQRQMRLLLIVTTLASLMFTAYLGVQFVRTSHDLDAIRPQGIQVSEALKKQEASLEVIKSRLAEYGQSHSDFAPILNKYGIKPAAAAALPLSPPPAAPVPPAAAPKK